MDRWEQEQEEIIKREHDLIENAKPLSKKQMQKNINRNWIEVIDESGNKHFIPKRGASLFKNKKQRTHHFSFHFPSFRFERTPFSSFLFHMLILLGTIFYLCYRSYWI